MLLGMLRYLGTDGFELRDNTGACCGHLSVPQDQAMPHALVLDSKGNHVV
jgi:hypothetical protein